MKYAWVENGIIRDVAHDHPSAIYHPDIAKHYYNQVPDDAENGDAWDGVTLTKPVIPEPVAPEAPVFVPPKISPIEFKMLFTSAERIALRTSTDVVVVDFMEIIQDPRLQQVDLNLQTVRDGLAYIESIGLIGAGRAAEILKGEVK